MATNNETEPLAASVGNEPDFAAMRDAIEFRHGIYFIFASILFCQFVNWIIKSQGPPKSLSDNEWKWRNLYVSWVHALISSVWALSSMMLYPELFANLMQHINYYTYFAICFATGYFFYDFLDLFFNNKCLEMWEVVLHHIAVAGMFYYNIHIKAQIAFNIIALSVEVNSLFLHWRKLLQMVRTPYDSRKYIIIKYMNLITFVAFRGVPLALISIGCFYWRHKVSTAYYIGIVSSIAFMDILNVILFWRLLKSDLLRSGKEGRRTLCSTVKRDCDLMNGHAGYTNGHVVLGGNNNFTDAVKTRKKEE